MRVIIRDLMALASTGQQPTGPVDLQEVLDRSVKLAWNQIEPRARLVQAIPPLPAVEGNDVRLVQVFVNLLVNAAQAIPEGEVERNTIGVRAAREPDGRVAVEISDTGSGIEPQHLSRLFEPFFTTKAPGAGTGLGLAVSHGIVTALGGELTVETAVGRGSTFRVRLPAA